VRRTDPRRRPFGTFIQEEICQPLGIDSLWVGIPEEVAPRVATLTNMPPIPHSIEFSGKPLSSSQYS